MDNIKSRGTWRSRCRKWTGSLITRSWLTKVVGDTAVCRTESFLFTLAPSFWLFKRKHVITFVSFSPSETDYIVVKERSKCLSVKPAANWQSPKSRDMARGLGGMLKVLQRLRAVPDMMTVLSQQSAAVSERSSIARSLAVSSTALVVSCL